MKKMSPKDLFSKKNLMATLLTCVATAGIIAGTFIFISYAGTATAINGPITYVNTDANNMASLSIVWNGDLTDTGKLGQCPASPAVPQNVTACYNAAIVTASSGITGNIAAIFRDPANAATLRVYFDTKDVIADIGNASITFGGAFADVAVPVTTTSFQTPPPPTAINGAITYTAFDVRFDKSSFEIQTNGTFSGSGAIGCPALKGISGTCYNTNVITDITGITGNVAAVMLGTPTSKLIVVFDNQNVMANVNSGTMAMDNTFGGISTKITGTSFQNPPPPPNPNAIVGSATYTAVDATNSNFSTITFSFNNQANTSSGTGSCGGIGDQNTVCYNTASVTDLSGTGVVGTSASDVTAVIKLNTLPGNGGKSGNDIVVYLGKANAITDVNQGAFITVNNLSGVASPITASIQLPPPANPNAINGSATYTAVDATNSNFSTIIFSFNAPANASSGTGSCGGIGDQNTVCYNPASVTNLSGTGVAAGVDAADVTAVIQYKTLPGFSGKSSNDIIVFLNQANAITDVNQGASITVNNFSGISSPITTSIVPPAPQNPSTVTGTGMYNATNQLNNNLSTFEFPFNNSLNTSSGTGSCGAIGDQNTVCYNPAGITSLVGTGLVGGIDATDVTAVIKYNTLPGQGARGNNELIIFLNAANVVADLNQGVAITVNNFSGISSPIVVSAFQTSAAPNPSSITGAAVYVASNPLNNNLSTITFGFNNAANTASGTGSCGEIGDQNTVCYNPAGIVSLSGTGLAAGIDAADVTAIIKVQTLPNQGAQPDTKIIVFLNQANAITDVNQGVTMTVNNFSGISNPITVNSFQLPAIQNPTAITGTISYNAQNPVINNYKTVMLVTFNQDLNTASGTGSCQAGLGIPAGATCYNTSGVTDLSGSSLANGVTESNIVALVKASSYSQFQGQNNKLVALFDIPNAASNPASLTNLSISFANFSGISSPITSTSFVNETPDWHISANETVYIESQQPPAYSSVTSALNQISIKFSGPIDMSTATNSNVVVSSATGTIPTSLTFDQTTFTLAISLSQAPSTGTLALDLSNLKAANSTSIPSSHFEWTVISGSATKPQVVSTSPSNNATGVSVLTNDIIIRFDQPLASPLNTTTGITITPSLALSTPYFDPADNTLHIQPNASLTANTQFQVKLITTDGQSNAVTDSAGNTIKGLYNNPIDNYTLSFTTGAVNITAPKLTWASFKTDEVWIGYNIPLQAAATTKTNWGITCGGNPVSLTQATVSDNSVGSYFEIKGATLTAGTNCTATLSNITGLNGVAFGGTDNVISGTVASTTTYTQGEDQNWGYGMCMSANCTEANRWADPMVMQWSPIKFEPNIKIQGTEANETLSGFPTGSLTTGDKIVIVLPTGSSVNPSTLGVIGTDINGSDGATLSNVYYSGGKVTVSASTYDQAQNKVTLTVGIDTNADGTPDANATTNASGYFEFILKGFINGSATTYNQTNNTGGAYATYSTISGTTSQPIESIGQSTPYTVAAAGSGSISGSVTKSVGGTGIQNVKVMADGPNGMISATTDSSGNYTISSLTNGNYFVFIDPNTTIGNYVVSSNQNYITLADGSNTKPGINFKLDEGTKTINVTIQSGSISDGTAKVMLEGFNYSKNQHVGKEITLDADGTTTSTLVVTPGEWEISVGFYNEATTATSANNTAGDFGFMKPEGQIVNVTDASGAQSVTLSLASTDATINVTVLDSSGAAVASANVYAYRPDGTIGGTQATTDSTGICALKVKSGTYTVGAMLTGAPGTQEQSVTVAANGTTSATFMVNVPSIIISGTVTGDNKEAWINAYNQTSGFFATAQSDKETGIYSLRVNPSITYTITANNYNGQNSATGVYASGNQNIVPVVSSNITGADFQNTASNFGTISGSVTPAESGTRVCAESYNTTTKNPTGKFSCSVTNDSGAFTITTARNSVSGERYKLSAYSMTYGALPSIDNIDISSTDATNKNISAGTTYQVTLNITGIPSTAGSVFFNMMNSSTGKGTSFEIKSITNGTATKTFSLPQGTYNTTLSVPGLGEIAPDTGKSVNLTSNQTLNFTVGNMNADVKTLNVTVKNGSGAAVQGAFVTADDFSAGTSANGLTDANGQVTLKVKVATSVTIRADSTNFSSTKTTFKKSDLSSTNNVSIELGSTKSSTVTFNVTGTTKSIWVDLASSDGNFWNGITLNASGTGTINVPANLTNATAYLHAQTGETKTITGISAGQTSTTAFSSFSSTATWLSTFMDDTPNMSTFKPNIGLSLDDSSNTGVKLEIGTNAIDTASDSYSAKIQTVANIPNNPAMPTKGIIGKEITFTDANGNIFTDIKGEYEVSIFLFKAEVDAARGIVFDSNGDLSFIQFGYWDSTTSSYVSESTTRTAYVKETASSNWTIIDLSTLVTNITTNADYYYDYKIELKSIVNHATIFSPIINSDGTPPSAPTGLSVSELSTTSSALAWTANSEPDLMEYEVYRSTSPSVTINDLNQVNTSPITTNSFTDGTLTAGTYYYIVTAVDDSGNESVASSEKSVVISSSTQVNSENTIQGSSSTPSHDDTDEDTETGDIDESTDDDSGITLDEGTEEEESDEGEENVGTDENTSAEETDYSSHWAKNYIEKILEAGIAQGVSSTQFEPDRELTRAEMTKMVLNAFDYDIEGPIESSTFSDIDIDEWYAPYVEKAYTAGIITGYSDGTFKPNSLVNRAEAMKIIVNTYAIVNDLTLTANSLPFTDVIQDAWYTKYISYGYYKGIVGGYNDGTFKPENAVTRAEFSKMTVLLLDL
ncbi:MAG: S-layer homology domain-containing protein [Candidatus Gracilibacteria bacterium]